MGTAAWSNWQALLVGEEEREYFEDELHSDTRFVGSPETFGPYSLSIVLREHQRADVCPALILRAGLHAPLTPEILEGGELAKTNTKGYHGGSLSDEIAALVSLEFGVRLRFAGTRLLSGIRRNDKPTGGPFYLDVPRTARPGTPDREILPNSLTRKANLENLDLTLKFATIRKKDQVQLIRAARSYANAIWWANEDPNQAWLQLITAIEIAAKAQQSGSYNAQNVIEEVDPALWTILRDLEGGTRAKLAKMLASQHRLTQTFVDFVNEFAPDPPTVRSTTGTLDWTKMAQHARVIYKHRSKALHEGTPFPLPMLRPEPTTENGTPAEVPIGLNFGGAGGVWMADQYPMTLSMFEYIARGALLEWWRGMTR